jgi:hypothetical protein
VPEVALEQQVQAQARTQEAAPGQQAQALALVQAPRRVQAQEAAPGQQAQVQVQAQERAAANPPL